MSTTKDNVDYKCNLITIGDSTVGKTSLLCQYMGQKNPLKQVATVGIDYFTKDISIDNKNIRVRFWDTAGQERYRSITDNFFKNANGIVLVFDINARESFDNLKIWIQSVNLKVSSTNIKRILLGNKTDLERNVSFEEGEAFAKEHGFVYFETSAKENINIKHAFDFLINEVYKAGILVLQTENEVKKSSIEFTPNTQKQKVKKDCC